MKKIFLLFPVAFLCFCCITAKEKEETAPPFAEKIVDTGIKNMYKLDNDLYRSAQPGKKGFQALEKKGIKSALNLREYHTDNSEAKGTSITLYKIPLAAGNITEAQLLNCLLTIEKAPKPVLVHCWHGSDRTGAVCAAYRIARQNWKVEDAVHEFTKGPYGFHSGMYDNLPKLLKSIDWAEFKIKLATLKKEPKP